MIEEVFSFKNISFSKEFTGGIGTRDKVSKAVFSEPLLPPSDAENSSHSFPGLCRRRNSVILCLFNQNSSAVALASGIVCLHRRLLIWTSETFASSPSPKKPGLQQHVAPFCRAACRATWEAKHSSPDLLKCIASFLSAMLMSVWAAGQTP